MQVPSDGDGNQCIECFHKNDEKILGPLTAHYRTKGNNYSKEVYIGQFIVSVGAFVIRDSESERTYISGIGLFFADRPSVTFGYKSLESYLFDAKPFGGINLAFSDVGIHALQILADSSASTWTGTPNDATDRIKKLVLDEMDILGSCFDVSTK